MPESVQRLRRVPKRFIVLVLYSVSACVRFHIVRYIRLNSLVDFLQLGILHRKIGAPCKAVAEQLIDPGTVEDDSTDKMEI